MVSRFFFQIWSESETCPLFTWQECNYPIKCKSFENTKAYKNVVFRISSRSYGKQGTLKHERNFSFTGKTKKWENDHFVSS